MTLIKKFDDWSEKHDSGWIDVLRMILGIGLIAKGFLFMANISALYNNLELHFGIVASGAAFMIAGIHLLAGFLILIGLATRLACLVQIPILIGAIILLNINSTSTEIVSSVAAFLLLIFFAIRGSGKFSAYYYIANSRRGREELGTSAPAIGAPLTAAMDKDGNLR